MIRICSLVLAILLSQPSFAQFNKQWRMQDMDLMDSVAHLDKNRPEEVARFFFKKRAYFGLNPDTLGFGWTKKKRGIGGGYISIYTEFYYFNNVLTTYIIFANLPHEESLLDEYRSAYIKFLPDSTGHRYSYTHNQQAIVNPLDDFALCHQPLDTSARIAEYMSPTSGIVYGYTGGIGSDVLENRAKFNTIKKDLSPRQIVQIMYSVNPASRLTAIEYYLRNKRKFKNRLFIDQWIGKVYKELPKVKTMRDCIGFVDNSRKLVEEFVKSKGNY